MIKILEMVWIEGREDWQVDYEDTRAGTQKGRRYIALPQGADATEEDIIAFIEAEINE